MGDNKEKSNSVDPFNDMKNYQFTPEELKLLDDCNKESFYQRGLPVGALCATASLIAMKTGYLKTNPRLGMFPKALAAALLGFVGGKFSYRHECAMKFVNLPDSKIGEILRKKMNINEPYRYGPGETENFALTGQSVENKDSDPNTTGSLHMDTDRPVFASLEELQSAPNAFNSPINNIPALSYDDLRKQNRDDHAIRRSQPYKPEERSPPINRPPPEVKNKYGDVMN